MPETSIMETFFLYSYPVTKIQVTWTRLFKWEVSGNLNEKCCCH